MTQKGNWAKALTVDAISNLRDLRQWSVMSISKSFTVSSYISMSNQVIMPNRARIKEIWDEILKLTDEFQTDQYPEELRKQIMNRTSNLLKSIDYAWTMTNE